ncbi:MAG: Threonine-phosphate decarboxylase [Dehalococcoidia bacterium]|nr:Threonine-phosphate decarboxylase [Bacillota bacterium]MBT9141632.1 Threonine-phosphate decarboxylase [Bacillota bacterium]
MNNLDVIHGGDVDRVAREYGYDPREILDYSANINPLPLPKTMKDFLGSHLDVLSRYPDRDYRELKGALAAYTGYPSGWIMVGNGATELIYLAARALKPRKVLIPAPSFADYERAFASRQMPVDYFEIKEADDFRLDVAGFIRELARGYDMTVLCSPNNPTGKVIPKRELLKILDEAQKRHTYVLLDETFVEFVPDIQGASILGELEKYENVIILRAFTKFFAVPGLRLGYCLAHPILLEKLKAHQEPWTVNALAALLGPWLLGQKEYVEKTRKWILAERPYFINKLRELKEIKVYDSDSNFILVKLLTRSWSVKALKRAMEGQGIMIRDASSFRFLDEHFFRLAIKGREGNDRVLGELEEILRPYM